MLEVIAKLKKIPDGAVVRLAGGTRKLTVRHKLHIHHLPGTGNRVEVHAQEGAAYLISAQGGITAYSSDKKVVWYTSLDELNRIRDEKEERKAP
jgi:hypothetical protein